MKQVLFPLAALLGLLTSTLAAVAPKAASAPASTAELPSGPPKKQTLIPPPGSPDRPAAEPPAGVIIPASTPSTPPPTTVPPAPTVAPEPAPAVPASPAAVLPVPAAGATGTSLAVPAPATPAVTADATGIPSQLAEVDVPPMEPNHIISEGDTLGAIAAKLYGNEAYGAVLTNYNTVDAKKLKIGQVIKTPGIAQMLNECGFATKLPEETLALLRVKKIYAADIAPKLMEWKSTMKTGDPVPEDLKKQMKDLRADLEKARQGIVAKNAAGAKPPESTLLQFRTASDILALLSKGDFGKKDNHIQEVHTRLGLGIAYGIFWARSGFK